MLRGGFVRVAVRLLGGFVDREAVHDDVEDIAVSRTVFFRDGLRGREAADDELRADAEVREARRDGAVCVEVLDGSVGVTEETADRDPTRIRGTEGLQDDEADCLFADWGVLRCVFHVFDSLLPLGPLCFVRKYCETHRLPCPPDYFVFRNRDGGVVLFALEARVRVFFV